MDRIIKVSDLEIKNTDPDKREFTGYASTFGNVDSFGDSIAPGAFAETIRSRALSSDPLPVLFEHSRSLDSHVGEVLEMREDEHGLFIRAALDSTPEGIKAYNLLKGRRIKGLSIGFIPHEVGDGEVDGQPVTVISSKISRLLAPTVTCLAPKTAPALNAKP